MRLEGVAVLIVSVFAYRWSHGSWGLFALLFLAPDLSMIGYLANVRGGAAIYNAVHTYVSPLLLAGHSVGTGHHTNLLLSLVWISHIGLDRMLGFGLKYPTRFKDTHLDPERHTIR
jgi:hypothetical protein